MIITQREIDCHRIKLIIEMRDFILNNSPKSYVISPLSEIEDWLIRNKDPEFSEEQMLKNIKSFLPRQKGITRMGGGLYEISKELTL